MRNTIVVFDFETTHKDADSDLCDIVEIGAVAIHSKNLEIIKDSKFFINVRPDKIEEPDYYENHKDTINWHLSLPENKDHTAESLIKFWAGGTPEKQALKMFHDYLDQFNFGKKWFTAPIAAGSNIKGYDLIIHDRLIKKHKTKDPFFKRDKIDLLDLCFFWTSYALDKPKDHKMDTLREFFALGKKNAHNAGQDVIDEATIIISFLKLFQKFSHQINFRKLLTNV